jgi:hypothetical protein
MNVFLFWGEFLLFLNVKNVISTHTNDFYKKRKGEPYFTKFQFFSRHIYTTGYASNHNIK